MLHGLLAAGGNNNLNRAAYQVGNFLLNHDGRFVVESSLNGFDGSLILQCLNLVVEVGSHMSGFYGSWSHHLVLE